MREPAPEATTSPTVAGDQVLPAVALAFAGVDLSTSSRAEVERVAAFLVAHPELGQIAVVANGHADAHIADRRAATVLDALVRAGVDPERVSRSLDYAVDAAPVAFLIRGLPDVVKQKPCGWWAPTVKTSERVNVDERGMLIFDAPIRFFPNGSKIDDGSLDLLDAAAAFLVANPKFYRVQIDGHVSWHATTSHSPSQRRAENVAKHFIRQGVERHRLVARGFSNDKPVASSDTEAGRQQNDRVEIFVQSVPKYLSKRCPHR